MDNNSFPNRFFQYQNGQRPGNQSDGPQNHTFGQGSSRFQPANNNDWTGRDSSMDSDSGWNASSLGVNYNFYFANPGGYQVNFSAPGNPIIFGSDALNGNNHAHHGFPSTG